MDAHELYEFDLNGYIVIENAIDPEVLEAITPAVDQWQEKEGIPHTHNHAKIETILTQDHRFLDLALSPKVIERVIDLIQFPRLKSTWLDFKARGAAIGFHSNHTPYDPVDAYYWQGNIYANLITVCYALDDVPMGGAALEVIPGSHKANYPLPDDPQKLTALRKQLPLKKGSALIFTHDINHGSTNSLDYVRRCCFTSFSTGSSAHTQGDQNLYQELFDRMPENTWGKYLLRQPKGDRDAYPQPQHRVADEYEKQSA